MADRQHGIGDRAMREAHFGGRAGGHARDEVPQLLFGRERDLPVPRRPHPADTGADRQLDMVVVQDQLRTEGLADLDGEIDLAGRGG